MHQVKHGTDPNRPHQYRQTILLQWLAFAGLGSYWLISDRTLNELGFRFGWDWGVWLGIALLLIMTGGLTAGWMRVQRMTSSEKAELCENLGDLKFFLPHTQLEYRWLVGVSFTAGIVEETIYRGFLFWYLAHALPDWAVLLVSSLVFGLCHSYQGKAGTVRVTGIGVLLGAYYMLTGSLWLPIIAHIVFDILQGRVLYEALRQNEINQSAAMNSPQGSG